MPEDEIKIEPQTKTANIPMTRRSFLKSAVLLPLTVIPRETQQSKNDYLSIETPEARYFPIYELHPFPVSGDELKRVLPPQDIFFYEFTWDARYFVDQPPQTILDASFPIPVNNTHRPNSARKYYVPRDHLEWLRANNTKICFEGLGLPHADSLTAILVTTGELIIGSNALARILLHVKAKENRGNKMDRRQFLKLVGGLASAWGISSVLGMGLGAFGKTRVKEGALERTVIKAHGLLSHAHPENSIVFFRNIMLARKLQFLGEVASKEKGQKAQITYNVGKGHAGIEDFLLIGKDWTLAFLNTMSNQFLKRVIDANGGLENFCSNVLFDPNVQNPTKTILVDQELKSFLNKKFGLSK